jgi:hypothetical protein
LFANDNSLGGTTGSSGGNLGDTNCSSSLCLISTLFESGLSSHLGFFLLLSRLGLILLLDLRNIDVLVLEFKSFGLSFVISNTLLLGHHSLQLGAAIIGSFSDGFTS